MKKDAIFIGVEVADAVASDPAIGAKLDEVCPVNIFTGTETGVDIVEQNIDECVLCKLCYDVSPGNVTITRLYDNGAAL
jgi:NAD-dependent dihydropyrimidine dehydrogenase PreA subunit